MATQYTIESLGTRSHAVDVKLCENTDFILEMMRERIRQDEKFGAGRHQPVGDWLAILGEEVGEVNKAFLNMKFDTPDGYPNAVKSTHLQNYKEELIQIASVCFAMLEDLENNGVKL